MSIQVDWTSPLDSELYISVYYALVAGYDVANKESWHFAGTVRSDVGELVFNPAVPYGVKVRIRAKVIDKWGRVSPWTHTVEV